MIVENPNTEAEKYHHNISLTRNLIKIVQGSNPEGMGHAPLIQIVELPEFPANSAIIDLINNPRLDNVNRDLVTQFLGESIYRLMINEPTLPDNTDLYLSNLVIPPIPSESLAPIMTEKEKTQLIARQVERSKRQGPPPENQLVIRLIDNPKVAAQLSMPAHNPTFLVTEVFTINPVNGISDGVTEETDQFNDYVIGYQGYPNNRWNLQYYEKHLAPHIHIHTPTLGRGRVERSDFKVISYAHSPFETIPEEMQQMEFEFPTKENTQQENPIEESVRPTNRDIAALYILLTEGVARAHEVVRWTRKK